MERPAVLLHWSVFIHIQSGEEESLFCMGLDEEVAPREMSVPEVGGSVGPQIRHHVWCCCLKSLQKCGIGRGLWSLGLPLPRRGGGNK